MTPLKRALYLILGQIITAMGVVGMLHANIGLEPWGCLHQGLSVQTGIPFGTCSILVAAIVLVIVLLFKEPIGLGTVVNSIAPGVLIDLLNLLPLPQAQNLWSGVLTLLGGAAGLALGTYFYMAAAMGSGPRDALMVALARAFHTTPGLCRTCLDVAMVALGWFLGGQVGVGTLLAAVLIGPMLQGLFILFHFDPKSVHQINFSELWSLWKSRLSRVE